ncbi:transposase [Xanthomonas axonopodis]|uniref:transposase n=1 Tax=Xanthomonas axonopodis TaxID=53413 RepID=UPI003558D99E
MDTRLNDDPTAYRCSSCPANLGQRKHSALTPRPCWLALGSDPIERSNAYRALLDEALSDELLTSIRLHLQQQQRALGHDACRAMVEAKTHRFAGVRPAHRPRKPNTAD